MYITRFNQVRILYVANPLQQGRKMERQKNIIAPRGQSLASKSARNRAEVDKVYFLNKDRCYIYVSLASDTCENMTWGGG